MHDCKASTVAELVAATADARIRQIVASADLAGLPSIRLSPGQELSASEGPVALPFAAGQDGIQLSSNNRVEGLELVTDPDKRAIFTDTGVENLSRLGMRIVRKATASRSFPAPSRYGTSMMILQSRLPRS